MNPPDKSNPYAPVCQPNHSAQEAAERAAREIYPCPQSEWSEGEKKSNRASLARITAIILRHFPSQPADTVPRHVYEGALEEWRKCEAALKVAPSPGSGEALRDAMVRLAVEILDCGVVANLYHPNKDFATREITDRILAAITPFLAQPATPPQENTSTPRVDAAQTVPAKYPGEKTERWWVTADFARQLERELNATKATPPLPSGEANQFSSNPHDHGMIETGEKRGPFAVFAHPAIVKIGDGKDGERLDWLENRIVVVKECMASLTPKLFEHVPAGYGIRHDTNIRAAIDAAMFASSPQADAGREEK